MNRLARLFGGLSMLVAYAAGAADGTLQVGVGKAAIEIPPSMLPFQGFGAERDPLQIRVLAVANGAQKIALAVFDLTSMSEEEVARTKQIVGEATGTAAADIFICVSHTFSAPHILPAQFKPPGMTAADEQKESAFKAALEQAAGQAARAAATLRPALLGLTTGTSGVNINRDVLSAAGWWLGANETGASDKVLSVLRFDNLQHHPLAILMNYGVQSSIMNESIVSNGNRAITADLAGAAVQYVESQYDDGTIAMFLVGAAGDQAPTFVANRYVLDKDGQIHRIDLGEKGFALIDLLGERLGSDAVQTSEKIADRVDRAALRVVNEVMQLDQQNRPQSLQDLHATKTYAFSITGKADAPYSIMQIGDTAIIGVQAELSSTMGMWLKKHSPFANTLVVTMVNGAAKYMPDAASYDQITYEAMNSSFARGSAEKYAQKILATLGTMRRPH